MNNPTIEEMEIGLAELQSKVALAEIEENSDSLLSAEIAYDDQLTVLSDMLNTTQIITKGVRKPDGSYEEVQSWAHAFAGCVGAQFVDLNVWRLHHLTSGFMIGYWRGERTKLPQFLSELNTLLSQVSADPHSEDRAYMKRLGDQASAMGVEKW